MEQTVCDVLPDASVSQMSESAASADLRTGDHHICCRTKFSAVQSAMGGAPVTTLLTSHSTSSPEAFAG